MLTSRRGSSRKKPRATILPREFNRTQDSVENYAAAFDAQTLRKVEAVRSKPAEFFEHVLGFLHNFERDVGRFRPRLSIEGS